MNIHHLTWASADLSIIKEAGHSGNSICQLEAKKIDGEKFSNSFYNISLPISKCFRGA